MAILTTSLSKSPTDLRRAGSARREILRGREPQARRAPEAQERGFTTFALARSTKAKKRCRLPMFSGSPPAVWLPVWPLVLLLYELIWLLEFDFVTRSLPKLMGTRAGSAPRWKFVGSL